MVPKADMEDVESDKKVVQTTMGLELLEMDQDLGGYLAVTDHRDNSLELKMVREESEKSIRMIARVLKVMVSLANKLLEMVSNRETEASLDLSCQELGKIMDSKISK